MASPSIPRRAACLALLLGWMVLGLWTTAPAGGLEEARARGRLLAGVKSDFPPFGTTDAKGVIQGFDADIARHLGRALFGDETGVELVPVTSGSRIPLLYAELIDLIVATMTVTPDRERVLDFSVPYFVTGSMVVTTRDSAIQELRELAGKRVGVLEGSVQQVDLPTIAPGVTPVAFKTWPEALSALRGKQVDALCQDNVAVLTEAKRSADLRTIGKPFLPRPYALAVRKGDRRLLDWLNGEIRKMKSDGTLQALRLKHFADVHSELPGLE